MEFGKEEEKKERQTRIIHVVVKSMKFIQNFS